MPSSGLLIYLSAVILFDHTSSINSLNIPNIPTCLTVQIRYDSLEYTARHAPDREIRVEKKVGRLIKFFWWR